MEQSISHHLQPNSIHITHAKLCFEPFETYGTLFIGYKAQGLVERYTSARKFTWGLAAVGGVAAGGLGRLTGGLAGVASGGGGVPEEAPPALTHFLIDAFWLRSQVLCLVQVLCQSTASKQQTGAKTLQI